MKDIPHTGPGDLMSGLSPASPTTARRSRTRPAAASRSGERRPIPPPLPKPTNIVCMAVNYMEDGTRTEPAPINAFMKSPTR